MQQQLYKVMMCLFFLVSFSLAGISQPKIGEQVPIIKLKDNKGKLLSTEDLKGKIYLIDFWASWCMPCRAANKLLKPIYNQYHNKGFEVFAISIDDDKANWLLAIKQDGTKWKHVIDNGGFNSKVASDWNIEAIPTSYLVDEEGKLLSISPTDKALKSILKNKFSKGIK